MDVATLVQQLQDAEFGLENLGTLEFVAKLMLKNDIHSVPSLAGSDFDLHWSKRLDEHNVVTAGCAALIKQVCFSCLGAFAVLPLSVFVLGNLAANEVA